MSSLPTSLVIYGATGDLSQRKLTPALYNLFIKQRLSGKFVILGLGRKAWDTDQFRVTMKEAVAEFSAATYTVEQWDVFVHHLHYQSGNFTELEDYDKLHAKLSLLEEGGANRLFYLAMPPRFYESIVASLGESGLVRETDNLWRRVIIEKPFGRDLASAQVLNRSIHRFLSEEQIYRIDHYLAKETVQNIMVFRFGNSIFEPLWNRNYIDHIQITAAETVDVGSRASYYDRAGVLRDMFQNHLLQVLSIVAMEPPASRFAESLRNEKVKTLAAVRRMSAKDVTNHTIRAQYDGYLDADGIAADSETPTYAMVNLFIDNWRWQGVPFYLRSGKAMAEKLTEVTIQFKPAPHMLFAQKRKVPGNTLTITIQPDEGIHLRVETKVPDTVADLQPVNMHFHYHDAYEGQIPEAYERLLHDALKGDASLFTRDDEVEFAWQIMDPILRGWAGEHAPPVVGYKPGSWGPVAADEFLAKDGRAWVNGAERPQIVQP